MMAALPEFIPISKGKELFAMTSWRDNGASRGGTNQDGSTNNPSSNNNNNGLNSAEEASGKRNGENGKGGKRSNGGGKSRRGRGNAKEADPQPPDVEDYFVNIIFPPEIPYKSVEFDLFANSAPLKVINVGPLRYLFRRSRAEEKEKEKDKEKMPPPTVASSGKNLPLQSSAALPGVLQDSEEEMPAISLPPSELTQAKNTSSRTTDNNMTTGIAAGGNNSEGSSYQVSLLFAERSEAVELEALVGKKWPSASASILPRSRSVLNTSLVLKCLPSLSKTEQIIEELQQLPHAISYIRLLRSERGVFKNVLFVKYPNCDAAEEAKLWLERFMVGTRPLKVEFKKKWKLTRGNEGSLRVENGRGHSSSSPSPSSLAHPEPMAGVKATELPQLVREIRVSAVHEGFSYQRGDLSKEAVKLLRQLCHSYGLIFSLSQEKVTVRRQLGLGTSVSPALRPSLAANAVTPSWAPVTPAPLRPMDFKGIRHWKEIRSRQNTLGIVRPLGPEDGRPPFHAGRGKPI